MIKKGFSLLEVMISITLITVALVSFAVVFPYGLKLSEKDNQRNQVIIFTKGILDRLASLDVTERVISTSSSNVVLWAKNTTGKSYFLSDGTYTSHDTEGSAITINSGDVSNTNSWTLSFPNGPATLTFNWSKQLLITNIRVKVWGNIIQLTSGPAQNNRVVFIKVEVTYRDKSTNNLKTISLQTLKSENYQ